MPTEAQCKTYWAKIFIAGPLDQIEQICREFVLKQSLCVTVTPTKYIYVGGEETGVEIGLINYPRFPHEDGYEITDIAKELAHKIMEETHQGSYTVMSPNNTYYYSRRDEFR